MSLSKSTRQILVLAIISIGLLGYSFIRADWTAPTANPPANNVTAPINAGATYQAKTGDLGAVKIRAGSYCDASGVNCFTATNSKSFYFCTNAESKNVNNRPCYIAAHPASVSATEQHYWPLMCLKSDSSISQTTTGRAIKWNTSTNPDNEIWTFLNGSGDWDPCGGDGLTRTGAIIIDIGS
ncbi:hypothetical protein A2592_03750 [Candidatus Kaiserbacteria bacterium RIFOXYD1_FULL_42_15]|uniref:Uncharacterized protein n=1 Tax=Candidatus Kaiserbacteria bacterium RIFOXYD1_FULL_42_15 TaxID=1798532 RepID=A0A1F6FQB6_9BACT|nr:MAG: hypothetical protein A2592_03750 [Candidatus Kaiserbacteria bacterium RIFOXYD1_FULL_42_15]